MDFSIDLMHIVSVFIVLFALIDALGSVPIFLNFKGEGKDINPFRSALFSFLIMVVFLFVGEGILQIFNLDASSFAIAGALVIFVISLEMVFGVEIFKENSPGGNSTFVPIVFPLIAGPGVLTALLTMRSEYSIPSIIAGIFLNMIIVFLVLNHLGIIQRILGNTGVYIVRKFFGIIVMAISVKLFITNITILIHSF